MKPLPIELQSDRKGRITAPEAQEAHLMAWLMSQLANWRFKEFFGDYSDYISFVPTSYQKEIDVLILNEIRSSTTSKVSGPLASCTILEIKADRCETKDLAQTLKYEDWLVKKKCAGDSAMVNSSILAHSFGDEVVDYVGKRARIERKEVQLLQYSASHGEVVIQQVQLR